jgi:hypothetical protein
VIWIGSSSIRGELRPIWGHTLPPRPAWMHSLSATRVNSRAGTSKPRSLFRAH